MFAPFVFLCGNKEGTNWIRIMNSGMQDFFATVALYAIWLVAKDELRKS